MPTDERLLAELAEVGHPVASVSDLRTSGRRYREAVPVLVGALGRVTRPSELEQIVRALSVPWARAAALDPLVDLFVSDELNADGARSLRWATGNALEILWDDRRYDDLRRIACEERFGRSREMVVLGLGRSKRSEAVDVLIDLLADPVVNGHAVIALRRLKPTRARAGLETMVDDPRAWVRREARRALTAIDAANPASPL